MHCLDREFSVFSILPPFNAVHAQVVDKQASGPRLLDSDAAEVDYQATTDADGSINSTSLGGKTDFWDFADTLFATTLGEGQGLTGLYMPADHPTAPGPQSMAFDATADWFSAEGIPITPTDDHMLTNTYPLMRIRAVDTECQRGAMKTGGMECFACHGGMLAVGGENPLLTDGSLDGTNDGGSRPAVQHRAWHGHLQPGRSGALRPLPWNAGLITALPHPPKTSQNIPKELRNRSFHAHLLGNK